MTFTTILPPHPSHMLSILPTYGRLRFFVGLDMKTAQSPTCQSTVVISLFKDRSVLHKRLLWRLIKGVEEEGGRRGEGGGKEGGRRGEGGGRKEGNSPRSLHHANRASFSLLLDRVGEKGGLAEPRQAFE